MLMIKTIVNSTNALNVMSKSELSIYTCVCEQIKSVGTMSGQQVSGQQVSGQQVSGQQVSTVYHGLKSGDTTVCNNVPKFTIDGTDMVGYHITDKIAYIPQLDYLLFPDSDLFTTEDKQQLKSCVLNKIIDKQDFWYDPFPATIGITCCDKDFAAEHESVIALIKHKLYSWLFRFPTSVMTTCNIQDCDHTKCVFNNKLWYYDGNDMFIQHHANDTIFQTVRHVTINISSRQRWSFSYLNSLQAFGSCDGGGWD